MAWLGNSNQPTQRQLIHVVQACNEDLRLLVNLRNRHLHSISQQPALLNRMNDVISAAEHAIMMAQVTIARNRTTLRKPVHFGDQDVEPVHTQETTLEIEKHHAAILSEIYRAEQIGQLATLVGSGDTTRVERPTTSHAFDNLDLLNDLMGDTSLPDTDPVLHSRSRPPDTRIPPAIELSAVAFPPSPVELDASGHVSKKDWRSADKADYSGPKAHGELASTTSSQNTLLTVPEESGFYPDAAPPYGSVAKIEPTIVDMTPSTPQALPQMQSRNMEGMQNIASGSNTVRAANAIASNDHTVEGKEVVAEPLQHKRLTQRILLNADDLAGLSDLLDTY